jgi:transcriptional regulator with XRE-family HTH domain
MWTDTIMSMPSGKQPESGKFARAITDEILMSMARQRISGAQLALKTSRSQSYISKRLRNEVPFTANDIEEICEVLGEDLSLILRAAVRSSRSCD